MLVSGRQVEEHVNEHGGNCTSGHLTALNVGQHGLKCHCGSATWAHCTRSTCHLYGPLPLQPYRTWYHYLTLRIVDRFKTWTHVFYPVYTVSVHVCMKMLKDHRPRVTLHKPIESTMMAASRCLLCFSSTAVVVQWSIELLIVQVTSINAMRNDGLTAEERRKVMISFGRAKRNNRARASFLLLRQ